MKYGIQDSSWGIDNWSTTITKLRNEKQKMKSKKKEGRIEVSLIVT